MLCRGDGKQGKRALTSLIGDHAHGARWRCQYHLRAAPGLHDGVLASGNRSHCAGRTPIFHGFLLRPPLGDWCLVAVESVCPQYEARAFCVSSIRMLVFPLTIATRSAEELEVLGGSLLMLCLLVGSYASASYSSRNWLNQGGASSMRANGRRWRSCLRESVILCRNSHRLNQFFFL